MSWDSEGSTYEEPRILSTQLTLDNYYFSLNKGCFSISRVESDYYNKILTKNQTIELCLAHKKWLTQKLAEPFDGDTVVITHFAPHSGSIAPAFTGHPANAGFIVPMDALMGKAKLWIHGHTHTAFDYDVNGTRIVCNPRGYAEEETGFRPEKVVNI